MFDSVMFSPAAIDDGNCGIAFAASFQGRPIKCSISAQALDVYFNAAPTAHEAAFRTHRDEIEGVAEALIRARGISSGELRIELSDLESSVVVFGRSVRLMTDPRRSFPPKG